MNEFLSKIYLTRKYAIILALVLLGTGVWFFTSHQSRVSQLATLDTEISEMQNQISQAQSVIGDVGSVKREIASLREMKQTLTSSIRKQEEISELVSKIVSVGEEVGVNFTSINLEANKLFSTRDRNSEYVKVTMNLDARAEYLEYGQFLERVNNLPFTLSIEQAKLNYSSALYPDLKISNRILLVLK
ncbi:MAG: type 4a pilus biogenesis protein PilO [Candidatus Marinimicrobia bacterium]|nr:type 4a pilus biogenesis protein PilO [Candidatus Neomarinimicrobiota bacterium]MCF7830180.1 type 4a pilus biogenesis protein PilO [Candidatus Neomarinimicrobiota bacterium]MCF7882086.1 type 4a pilus biogenesis protein PilO [Candidatus Neomarinimicrobiota bacterium]